MPIYNFMDKKPQIADDVFIAETAVIIGDVTIGSGSSIWYGTVLRGDIAPIVVGKNVSIQENSVVHVDQNLGCYIGDNVTIGHGAIVHAATIEDNCLIGMGAIVLDDARVGKGSLVGASSLVPPKKQIPPQSQVMGAPCAIKKQLTDEAEQGFIKHAMGYVELAAQYLKERNNER